MIADEILVEKAKKGNLESFEILVDRHQNNVFNIAFRFTGNKEDASDLAQEAFLKAYKGLKKFRQESSFKTWIYQITTNVCRDFLRKNKKVKEYSLNDTLSTEDGEVQQQIEDFSKGPEELYEDKELSAFIQKLINDLPQDYKEVIILREIQQLSYDEISEVLDCSLGTVKSRLNRARKSLKERVLAAREQNQINLRQTN